MFVIFFLYKKKTHEHKDIEWKQGLILTRKEKWAVRDKNYTEKNQNYISDNFGWGGSDIWELYELLGYDGLYFQFVTNLMS